MNEKKRKIPHPKINRIIPLEKHFIIPPSLKKSMEDFEKKNKNNKRNSVSRKSFITLTKLPITHKLISKEDLIKDLTKIQYINKPLYKKLSTILNEEERIINTDYYKTNNFSFNFEIFSKENKTRNKKKHSLSFNKQEDISYLDRYDEIIRDKHSNEKKAQKYIETINKRLENKKKVESNIYQDLYNFCKNRNEKRLNNSIEIDAKISILKSLHKKNTLIRSDSVKLHESKLELKIKKGEEKEKELEKEIQDSIKKQKEEEEKNSELENYYIQNCNQVHHEIKQLKDELNDNIQCGINYYLEILKKGNDTRKSGLSWVVRRLLKLNYEPKKEDFPNYFNEKMSKFIIQIAKKQLEKQDLISKYKYHQFTFLKGLKRNSQFVISKENTFISHSNSPVDKYVMKKVGELLDKHVELNYFNSSSNFNKIDLDKKNKSNFSFKSEAGNSIFFLHKSFLNPTKLKQFNQILEIKRKIEIIENEIKKIDNDMYEYIHKKEIKDHKKSNENINRALFGIQTKYKINIKPSL